MDADKRERYGVSWDDAWHLLHEVESGTGLTVSVRLWPPLTGKGGRAFVPQVALTVERTKGGVVKPLTRTCQIGGAAGARTYPAALVRALHELAEALEADQETARQLAAF